MMNGVAMSVPADNAEKNLRNSLTEMLAILRLAVSEGHVCTLVFQVDESGEVSEPKMTINYKRKKKANTRFS